MPIRIQSVKTLKSLGRLHKILNKSSLELDVSKESDGSISKFRIDIEGLAAKLPSVSNNREIAYCTRNVKGKGFRRVPFLRKSDSQNLRLAALTRLYFQAMLKSNDFRPDQTIFGDQLTTCLVLLCSNKRRHDSHNYAKTVGDWLQSVHIINDDTNTEILCYKKSEYPELFKSYQSTTIIIVQRSLAQLTSKNAISEILGK